MKLSSKLGIAVILLSATIGIGVKVMQSLTGGNSTALAPVNASPRAAAAQPHLSQMPKQNLVKWQPLLDDSLSAQERLALTDGIREGGTPEEVAFLFAALD